MSIKASFYISAFFVSVIFFAAPAMADTNQAPKEDTSIRYFSDPIHPSVNDNFQGHPLAHLKSLAEDKNDARAQFMMGDMLAKGKGGFAKDEGAASLFFQQSGKGGNPYAFIRLAAMAEKQHQMLEAYQWYSIGVDYFPKGENRLYMIRQKNQLSRDHKFTNSEIRKIKQNIKIWHDTDFKYPDLPPLLDLSPETEEEGDKENKESKTETPAETDPETKASTATTTITEKKESKGK